ncbi:MAG: sulfotransferase [Halieaceae bacterium]|nr:sulfotransferase [Halieaceae bacterium]
MKNSQLETSIWSRRANEGTSDLDLRFLVPLDESSLLNHARQATGLSDFGSIEWMEPFQIMLSSIDFEADLTFIGRLMSRNDILQWLKNRLLVERFKELNPHIVDQEIIRPTFVIGLPRSGTSILYELLAQDPEVNVPLIWEAFIPCPDGGRESLDIQKRKLRANTTFSLWQEIVPNFSSIHKMSADIPAECGLLMANTFVSDHIASLHQTPSYSKFCSTADLVPVYKYHKLLLQILQSQKTAGRWLLKAPEHQIHLEALMEVYPDANIIQTHRDPIVCMASTASLLRALYLVRSNKEFDTLQFENIVLGQATAERLTKVMNQRGSKIIDEKAIFDSRYQDFLTDPVSAIERIYNYFGIDLSLDMRAKILDYLRKKPQNRDGEHFYPVGKTLIKDRELFSRYQKEYDVINEV